MRLDVYFEIMHILVEQIDLGLLEIAKWLEEGLERAAADLSYPSPGAERECEWREWSGVSTDGKGFSSGNLQLNLTSAPEPRQVPSEDFVHQIGCSVPERVQKEPIGPITPGQYIGVRIVSNR